MSALIVFDFDGVLNPIPFKRTWVGPASGPDSLASIDPANWQIVEVKIDPATHFVPDAWETITTHGYYGEYDTHIRWSTELVGLLQRLVEETGSEFRWLTSWRDRACTVLAPLMGMDTTWKSIDWVERHDDRYQLEKLVSLEQIVRAEKSRPLVWVDDVTTRYVAQYYGKTGSAGTQPSPFVNERTLMVQSSTLLGISRQQWQQVDEFVRRGVSLSSVTAL